MPTTVLRRPRQTEVTVTKVGSVQVVRGPLPVSPRRHEPIQVANLRDLKKVECVPARASSATSFNR